MATDSERTINQLGAGETSSPLRLLVPLFTLTLFTSALLLFWIQPLLTKMALPLLGGAPAVWNIAMVFFQAMLLAGYAYAHLASHKLSLKAQLYLHLAIVAVALTVLPLTLRGGYDPEAEPVSSLLILLGASVGLPFFAVSATAPLLQHWFSKSGHRHASDPYFLYSASNLGSILALLAFPFLLEPLLTLGEQSTTWSALYIILLALILACGLFSLRGGSFGQKLGAGSVSQGVALSRDEGISPTWKRRLHWILLAFAPSSLLLGVTQHITTDVAAVPLLWVIPLALYLLTYVIAFARRPIFPHYWVIRLQPYILLVALLALFFQKLDILFSMGLHLAVFFLLALSCHGGLVERRPAARHLTDFYLSMSVGGVLGGVFNVLVAPLIFSSVYEYALAIVAACLLRPGRWGGTLHHRSLDVLWPGGIFLIFLLASGQTIETLTKTHPLLVYGFFGLVGAIVFSFQERPLRYGLAIAALLFGYSSAFVSWEPLHQLRSFFGVYRVVEGNGGATRILLHGTTLHGAQQTAADRRLEPVTYYTLEGPLGQAFAALRTRSSTQQVGLVGLGVGSALCYARAGERWSVFEIDPAVVEIAKDRRYFSYWDSCFDSETFELYLGDARLRLEEIASSHFDLMILDAYSSDAIPVHLMTKEALALYLDKLAPDGVLLFHISSRHLDLEPVLAGLAAEAGLAAKLQLHRPEEDAPPQAKSSIWVALAPDPLTLGVLPETEGWRPLRDEGLRTWSDDYSNIVRVLR